MKSVKNLVLSCITAGIAIVILSLFASEYYMFTYLAHLPELFAASVTGGVYVVLYLASLIFIAISLVFAVLGIFCDAGLIKSDKAFKALKSISLIFACFALFFMLAMLAMGIIAFGGGVPSWQAIVVVILVIALFVVTIMNAVAASKFTKEEKKEEQKQ